MGILSGFYKHPGLIPMQILWKYVENPIWILLVSYWNSVGIPKESCGNNMKIPWKSCHPWYFLRKNIALLFCEKFIRMYHGNIWYWRAWSKIKKDNATTMNYQMILTSPEKCFSKSILKQLIQNNYLVSNTCLQVQRSTQNQTNTCFNTGKLTLCSTSKSSYKLLPRK